LDGVRWLSESRSGFYDWRGRSASTNAERRERLKLMIEAVFEHSPSALVETGRSIVPAPCGCGAGLSHLLPLLMMRLRHYLYARRPCTLLTGQQPEPGTGSRPM